MGDMIDTFRAMDEDRKERHAQWFCDNMKIIDECGIKAKLTNSGESVLFREHGKPKVDFYPSTGRWRVAGKKKTFSGGAESFLGWYKKQ